MYTYMCVRMQRNNFIPLNTVCRQTRLIPPCHAEKHNVKVRIYTYARFCCKYSVYDVESRSVSRELFRRVVSSKRTTENHSHISPFSFSLLVRRAHVQQLHFLRASFSRQHGFVLDYSGSQLLLALDFTTFILTPALLISSRTRSTTTRGAAVLPI